MRFRRKKELGDQASEASGPKRRRRKPLLLAALAGIGGWVVLKARRATPHADETPEASDAQSEAEPEAEQERAYTSRARQKTTAGGNAATR